MRILVTFGSRGSNFKPFLPFQIPSEDIYDPSLDPDELGPQPRLRARTIGNGQAARGSRHAKLLADAVAAARKRREERKLIPTVFRYPGANIPKNSEAKVRWHESLVQHERAIF